MDIRQAADEFLANRRIAVTGVSRNPANHGGTVVYQRLRERGYEVFAINPNADTVEGDPCFRDLESIPEGVDAVVIATRPSIAEQTMHECVELGIDQVWMHRVFGTGSVSDEATAYGRHHGITVIDGGCTLMFEPCDDGAHRVMRPGVHLDRQGPQAGVRRATNSSSSAGAVDLYWLPLGAGDHVVRRFGRMYEALVAAREHRDRCDLYHAALEVHLDGDRYVIESAPVWDRPEPDRGVVAEGPVGLPWLGRSKWFRYEVRRWRDGLIPDVAYAVESPRTCSRDQHSARRVLDLAPDFPALTWGRDELDTGDMWNSNALIAWLLVRSGHDIAAITPPARGRVPGWTAGVIVARRPLAPRARTYLDRH